VAFACGRAKRTRRVWAEPRRPAPAGATLQSMANIQKRGGYTPRRAREQRAYRLIQVGGVSGALGVVGLLLAVAGAIEATVPVILLIVAVVCLFMFRGITGQR
jgi:hypothetical protein